MIFDSVTRIKQVLEREQNSAVATLLQSLNELLDLLPQLANKWEEHSRTMELSSLASRYPLPVHHTSHRGRPRLNITQDQLEYLRSLSFLWSDISRMLGVSRMTIYRRRIQYNMILEPSRLVSDGELMEVVCQVRQELPDLGQSMLAGRLRGMGLHVTRDRIREAVRRSDPLNTALRWHSVTIRRPYSVPGPNSLWHIGMFIMILSM